MHTVRNRRASSPRARNAKPAPPVKTGREELTFMLRHGAPPPPAFPADLIIPAHRGAVITAAAWPAVMVPPVGKAKPKRRVARPAAKAPAPPEHTPLPKIPEPERAPALALPPAPEPVLKPDAPAESMEMPIPRDRALVVRRQGLADVISHVLIEAGVRLARWSARRRRAEVERKRIRAAVAKHRAMVAQLEALEALRGRIVS
jgi:hypothetical protein